jgi:hypothetical protein
MQQNEKTLQRVYKMVFARVYPMYIEKAKKKGRTKKEVDEIICWLTGYTPKSRYLVTKLSIGMQTWDRVTFSTEHLRNHISGTLSPAISLLTKNAACSQEQAAVLKREAEHSAKFSHDRCGPANLPERFDQEFARTTRLGFIG